MHFFALHQRLSIDILSVRLFVDHVTHIHICSIIRLIIKKSIFAAACLFFVLQKGEIACNSSLFAMHSSRYANCICFQFCLKQESSIWRKKKSQKDIVLKLELHSQPLSYNSPQNFNFHLPICLAVRPSVITTSVKAPHFSSQVHIT